MKFYSFTTCKRSSARISVVNTFQGRGHVFESDGAQHPKATLGQAPVRDPQGDNVLAFE